MFCFGLGTLTLNCAPATLPSTHVIAKTRQTPWKLKILKQQIYELEDAGKSKDAANKRCLQKLEFCPKDLSEALAQLKTLEEQTKETKNDTI